MKTPPDTNDARRSQAIFPTEKQQRSGERSSDFELEVNAVSEANAKFRAFFEQGSYFAGVMTLDGVLIEANRLSLEKCGFTRSDVIGRKFWDCGWWNRSAELQEIIRQGTRQAAQGLLFRQELPYFVADGSTRRIDLILSPVKDEHNRVIFIAPTGTDITERNQAEQIKSRLASIVETSDDAIISKDLNSVIMTWNAGATRLFGYTEEEVIGRSIVILIPPERVDEEPSILERIRRGERIDHYETVRRRKDGSLVEISLTVSPIVDDQGQVVGASKIARDITESKRVERKLLAADQQKNEFLATLAHELRNPLAPIRNALNILKLTRGEAAFREHVYEMMERQLNQLVRLVDDLLEISRITMGKIELCLETVEIKSIISHAIETSKPLIDMGSHRFEVHLPETPLFVVVDAVRLSQVVANLLNNAAKYTKPGGEISLRVLRENQKVIIAVRDNGIGIAPDLLPHVLEMFRRTEQAKSHSKDGLGIGLALAKKLVEMHGGSLEGFSAGEGQGSEFTVRLPLLTVDPNDLRTDNQLSEQHPSSLTYGKHQKIMVVDDNQDVALSLATLLRILGNDVVVANNGDTAIQTFETFRPSMVFLDLGMPEMDGYEVARRLHALPVFQNVTLIALTGWGQEEDRQRSREAGFDHHIVKPMNLAKLQALLSVV